MNAQIHALLATLNGPQTAAFARKVKHLQLDRRVALRRSEARALAHALTALPGGKALPERQQQARDALFDLSRAVEAELLLQEKIAEHAHRQASNNLPGALQETGTGASLGTEFGVAGGVTAGVSAGATRTTSTSTFDDLAVATFRNVTVRAEVSATAGLPAGVGAGARLSGQITRGTGEIADKMPDRVLELARASVSRKLGGPALLRVLKRVTNPSRDRYAERISRAMAWQSRLPMLIETPAATAPLSFPPAPPAPIEATLGTIGTTAGVSARYAVGELALSAEGSRTEVKIDLPVRLTDAGDDAVRIRGDADIQQALDARLMAVLNRVGTPTSPSLRLANQLHDAPRNPRHLSTRLDALRSLESEFTHLEALGRHALTAPHQAVPPLASLARAWGSPGTRCEPVMIRMLDTVAWLQATPAPADRTARAQWDQLQATAYALAERIHGTALPHDRQKVYRATHAFAEMTQRIATRQGNVQVSAQWELLGVGARAAVARHEREDADPLRAGRYVDVTLTGEVTPSAGLLLEQIQRRLTRDGVALPIEDVQRVLGELSPSFPTTGNVRCVLRFFQPAFQQQPEYPEKARGTHLQAVRLSSGVTHALGLKVPLPVLPGITPKLGVQHTRSEQVPLRERLCEGTLTGALLRYNSLHTRDTDEATTWARLLELQGDDLDRLAGALARPDSVPAQEARYLLRDADLGTAPPASLALLDALDPKAGRDTQRGQLHALFQALAQATGRTKRASPLIGPPVLAMPAQG